MAIIARTFEGLKDLGTAKVSLENLQEKADAMEPLWDDNYTNKTLDLLVNNDDIKVGFHDSYGRYPVSDITDYAFAQMCSKVGVPAAYVQKCISHGMTDLAIKNYDEWASVVNENTDSKDNQNLVRTYDGVIHAVLTNRYNVFDNSKVLQGLRSALDTPEIRGRYLANEAFLSPDKMHIRFVNFDDPIRVGNEKLNSGFTISSSNIGSGALSIKYFLYRFACRNGMVWAQNGGMLYRQTHLRQFETSAPDLFKQILFKVKDMDARTQEDVAKAMTIKLDPAQFEVLLSKAQHELHFGQGGKSKLINLADNVYDHSLWGVANAVTELAQNYTLDERLSMEEWAGRTVSTFAA